MALRFQLSHKLIGLVCIPLAFEFIFVAVLLFLQTQSETQITRLEHSKAVVSRINELAGLLYAHVLMLARQEYTIGMEASAGDESELRETAQELEEITFNDPAERRESKKIIEITNNILGYTKSIEESGSWAESVKTGKLFMLTTELIGETRTFLRQEKQIQSNSDVVTVNNDTRSMVINLLIVLMIISTLLTFVIAWWLQKTIAQRIGVMIDNTFRLAADQPMHDQIRGTDEIAALDRVFHQMAATLKEAEQERKRNEQLKADFVAMVSHDLRTPLTSTQLFVSLLTDKGTEPIDLPVKAKKAAIEIARLIRLINNLLDLEKAEGKLGFEIQIDSVPLSVILQQSVTAVEDYGKQNSITVDVPKTDLVVDVDQDKIVQVTVNLLANAIKFSQPGSLVHIEIKNEPQFVEIAVLDNGRGIAKKFHQNIFDRYKQVSIDDERLKGGTGLGLAICKVIVELHGGKIGVESEEGHGSKFWFRLPQQPLL